MTSDERKLPRPEKTPFGPGKRFERPTREPDDLVADELASAAMQGKLDQVVEEKFPDNENARRLVGMMMGMTGMGGMGGMERPDPSATGPAPPTQNDDTSAAPPPEADEGSPAAPVVPDEVREAIQSGNVGELMGLLAKEHRKRTGMADDGPTETGGEKTAADPDESAESVSTEAAASGAGESAMDKETLDEMIRISRENGVTPDWILARALKLYLRDYRLTGRM